MGVVYESRHLTLHRTVALNPDRRVARLRPLFSGRSLARGPHLHRHLESLAHPSFWLRGWNSSNTSRRPLARDMGIDLGRADASVAKQFLDDPEVRTTFQQVGRETVAQRSPILHMNCLRAELNTGITRATGAEVERVRALPPVSRSKSISFDSTMGQADRCPALDARSGLLRSTAARANTPRSRQGGCSDWRTGWLDRACLGARLPCTLRAPPI